MRWAAWGWIPSSSALVPLSNSSEVTLIDDCARRTPACSSHPRLVRYADELRNQPHATIVLNHWRRPVENLRGQLRAGLANGVPVWVCIFGSPHADEYVEEIRHVQAEHPSGHLVRLVFSDVDLGVQGRFQVALGVKTRFIYIVDDDVIFPATAIEQYEQHFERQLGIYGVNGHVRGASEEKAGWVEGPAKPVRVDYVCGGWFLEAAWLHAFFREPRGTTVTGEDMHLSYTARKYLGVETYAVRFKRDTHPESSYPVLGTEETTTTPAMFALRSDLVHDCHSSGGSVRNARSAGCGIAAGSQRDLHCHIMCVHAYRDLPSYV
mmetsp:Transcript_47768/g.126426  ORF Transcript_47768/g.126426 Transcript_47768/m.126426 type:complete len:322 (+) Transcript_47768:14-979(+)